MSKVPPENDPTSIGNILVAMGLVGLEDLKKLAGEFHAKTQEELFGQFVAKRKDISRETLELALIKQRHMRGKITHKMMMRSIEITQGNHNKLVDGVDQLILTAKVAVSKANGK